ncbi:glycosyltransferase [Estrella lausannensis]|uniref:Glycosyl transferase n=1 Tax=Estrella lausannensis TaxID=483423 RepID=A0A0H5DRE9_9BACT|nr:glycosyltransferase [Estrella lausannensis]CRX38763.1 hypothetical protein ELAC_1427 [Estrella lausannensis]
MHVLFIPSWYPQKEDPLLGIFFKEQALAMMKLGTEVGVIYPEVRPLKNLSLRLLANNRFQKSEGVEESIQTTRLHGWNLFPRIGKLQMSAWISYAEFALKSYVKRWGKPDILHAHSFLWGGIAAASLSKRWGIPFVVTEHRNHFVDRIALDAEIKACWTYSPMKRAFHAASKVVGVSTPLTSVLQEYLEDASRFLTIPNSVDTDFFKPRDEVEKEGFQLITVAQLEERKNLPMLLRSFHRFLSQEKRARLVILGEGPERERLSGFIKDLNLEGKVSMPGKVSREAVRKHLMESRAFLFSSDSESFGVALIEAMAAGLPVLSTRCGGPEDIVTEETGILVPKRDEEKFYEGLLRLIRGNYDPQSIHKIAKSRFHSAAIASRYLALYREVLAR